MALVPTNCHEVVTLMTTTDSNPSRRAAETSRDISRHPHTDCKSERADVTADKALDLRPVKR